MSDLAKLRREVAALKRRLEELAGELDRTRKVFLEALAEVRKRSTRPPPPKP